ncbi:uncharacterized protein METZ01_LOCUS427875 [marine metagenome]|uniref:Uncharacterized protein n=1 Tax=marine metagenome TaxID=408172 RepID=A0A382XX09_9ZZZZ
MQITRIVDIDRSVCRVKGTIGIYSPCRNSYGAIDITSPIQGQGTRCNS